MVDGCNEPVAQLRMQICRPIIAERAPAEDVDTAAIDDRGGEPAGIRKQSVVVPDERYELAARVAKGGLPVLGHRENRIRCKVADARIRNRIDNGYGFGVPAVILDHDLVVLVVLLEQRGQCVAKGVGAAQRRDH